MGVTGVVLGPYSGPSLLRPRLFSRLNWFYCVVLHCRGWGVVHELNPFRVPAPEYGTYPLGRPRSRWSLCYCFRSAYRSSKVIQTLITGSSRAFRAMDVVCVLSHARRSRLTTDPSTETLIG